MGAMVRPVVRPIVAPAARGVRSRFGGDDVPLENAVFFTRDGLTDIIGESTITFVSGSADNLMAAVFSFDSGTVTLQLDTLEGGDVFFDSADAMAPIPRYGWQWYDLLNTSYVWIGPNGIAGYSTDQSANARRIQRYLDYDPLNTGTELVGWWGDSLALGNAPALRTHHANVANYGVGGETSIQIKTRFDASSNVGDTVILWAGNNNPSDTVQVLSDIAGMVAGSGDNYLVMGLLQNAAHLAGNAAFDGVLSINADLATTYGSKYLDIQSYLISQYDPEDPQDVIDVANGHTPSSLRDDDIHLNETGRALVAARVHQTLLSLGYYREASSLFATVGNCLTINSDFVVTVQPPSGHLGVETATEIANAGTAAIEKSATDGLIISTSSGTVYNLRITLSDGSVVVFPCNEGTGSAIWGYDEADGAIYIGHIGSYLGGTASTIWAGTQSLYHHAQRYGTGALGSGQLGPEKIYTEADRDFSSDTGRWSAGAGWAITGGAAVHTGATAGIFRILHCALVGATLRAAFDIPTYGGSGLIGLPGGQLAGGYYPNSTGSKTKDFVNISPNFTFYSTADASVDNVSVKEIYQADARIPANPLVIGTDCLGNTLE